MAAPAPRSSLILKVAAIAAVGILLLAAQRAGVFQRLATPSELRQTLLALGPRGYLAFVLAYAVLQPFGVPGTVFVMAAPLVWPWPVAFALSMIGTMAASVVGFSFARFVAREWVSRVIPERFRKYDQALEKRALSTVFFLRFVFWMPPLLHAFLGVSKVSFSTHFWGSLLGYIVPLFLVSYFGEKLFDLARTATPAMWVGLLAGTLLFFAGAYGIKTLIARRRLPRPDAGL